MSATEQGQREPEGFRYPIAPFPLPLGGCCGGPPSYTQLLNDPVGVLSDEQRWPSHLCQDSFLHESTYRWAHQTAKNRGLGNMWPIPSANMVTRLRRRGGDPVDVWAQHWPLPISMEAIRRMARRCLPHGDVLTEGFQSIVPFEGDEAACWVLRVEKGGNPISHYASLVPRGLAELSSDEKNRIYRMIRLRVFADREGVLTADWGCNVLPTLPGSVRIRGR